jgi:polar amino acid transport system ATP-binding protein
LLELRSVCKSYGDTSVLRSVSFSVPEASTWVLLGPSGSGKSTLLRCIALLERIDKGAVLLNGRQIGVKEARGGVKHESERELAAHRSEIGMVFQHFNLFPHMTACENVMLGLIEVRKLSRNDARSEATRFLDRVGLTEEQWRRYPRDLSGGQQQRVAIARALVMRPKLMLFDEPTSALDAEMVREVLDVMEGLSNDGMTMIVVTHELRFARRVADEILFMDEGAVVESAPRARFFDAPRHERTRSFLAAIE